MVAARQGVLIVDDSIALAENLAEILEDAGYTARVARTCAEALQRMDEGIDVALVDVRLPDGDGVLLSGKLKEKCDRCEVVLLTGHASVESAAAAIRAGAAAYLVKPCVTPELLLTVGQAAQKARLREEKFEFARRAHRAETLATVGTLTAGLSHEIRNPLNSAALQLSVLERRIAKLPEDTRPPLLQPLTLVRDEIRRLDHILSDFLEFARPKEAGRTPVALEGLVRSTVELVHAQAEQRGVVLDSRVVPGGDVVGDEGRLRQVLMNLVINAIDAAGVGGRVRVTLGTEGVARVLTVEDSGHGIPEEIRERIFEPFFTTKERGSGLGLAIVHAIVSQHGGRVELDHGDLGGAKFVIRLPFKRTP